MEITYIKEDVKIDDEILNNYELENKIGSGGYGRVYKIKNTKTRKKYALKIHKKNENSDSHNNEHKILKELECEGIIRLLEYYDRVDYLYLVMEYGGINLKKWRASHKDISVEYAPKFIKAIASALKHCHDHGYIYTDLKPENVLVDRKKNIRLCDFGALAKITTGKQIVAVTHDYMSPELIKTASIKQSHDVWCLGVLSMFLLIGVNPYLGKNREETRNLILNFTPDFSSFGEIIANFLSACTNKCPEERIPMDDILKHEFVQEVIQ